jgi:hypothetical protein
MKLAQLQAMLVFTCVIQFGTAQLSTAKAQNMQTWGSEDRTVYIDLDKLSNTPKSKGIFDFYDSKLTPNSFYLELNWNPNKCWEGSQLREGVIAYCLPHAKLGRTVVDLYPQLVDRFVSIGGACSGIYVWYEPGMSRYYLWSGCWNFTNVLGPFSGNPNTSLKRAIKPRKEQQLGDVSLSVVSQRWMYPDERQVRMPRDEHYDCAHGHLSGRAIERSNLNTFITSFRLTNNSRRDVFYLANQSNSDPLLLAGSNLPDDGRLDIQWIRLPVGASVEFDLVEIGWELRKEETCVVTLNTEPTYWDETQVRAKYRSLFRTFTEEMGNVR